MNSSLLDTILKHPFKGDFELSFSDSVLNEIVAEKVNLPGVAAIDITCKPNQLSLRAYLGLSRKLSIKEDVELEFDSFYADDKAALLVFRIGGAKIAKLASLIGVKSEGFISLADGKLVVDLYKLKLLKENRQIKDNIKSLKDVFVGFSPGTISVKIKLLHNSQAV